MRGKLFWLSLAALLVSAIHGVAANGLLRQPIWSEAGLTRLLWYSAAYWTLALIAGSRFLHMLLPCALVYAAWSVGPLPIAGLALLLAGAFGVGGRLLPGNAALRLPLGLATYALVAGALAHFPVNTPALHGALAAMGAVAGAWPLAAALRGLAASTHSRWLALPLYPASIHLLAALFPEVSSDGLAVHLAIPAWVAAHKQWNFDPEFFSWAVMPMSGDWAHTAAYLLGGEAAARLLNFSMLVMLASVIHSLARRIASKETALLAPALFLSTPVAYLATGSLFVENFWTLMTVAALAAVVEFHETGKRRCLPAAGVLAGAAVSGKLLAVPIAGLVAAAGLAAVLRGKPRAWKHAAAAAALGVMLGAAPYVVAFLKTGNPVFPMYNTVFRSPLFAADIAMADPRYPPAPPLRFLWDATFHSARYLDGHNGGLGFHYWLLLPLTLLLLRRITPAFVYVCIGISIIWVLLVTSVYSYLRYLYPALALLCVAFAWTLEEPSGRLRKAAMRALAAALVLVNVYFLSAGSSYTRDFTLPPWDEAARGRYLEQEAPLRALVEHWNRTAPGEPVAFLDDDQVAGLAARAYTASWRTWLFRRALDGTGTPGEVMELLRARKIRHAAAPSPGAWFAPPHPAGLGLLLVCGEANAQSGKFSAYEVSRNCAGLRKDQIDRKYFDEAPYAPPGEHQDISTYLRYRGRWLHDRQFAPAAGHTLTYTETPGDSVTFRFIGSRVRVTYTAAVNRGDAEVILDGRPGARLSQRSVETRWQQEAVFDAGAPGRHTLLIRHAGEGRFIDLDKLTVE